jgi:hypothetical protein
MPFLGALIAGLFGSLATFLARFVGIKFAFGAAAVAAFAVLTIGFLAVIASTLTAIAWSGTLPDGFIMGFSYFMPSNFPTVVSALISLKIVAALYRWNNRQLVLFAK